jgi:ParB family chromosome partitioning protein
MVMDLNALKGQKKSARPALGRGLSALISAPSVSLTSSAAAANQADAPEIDGAPPSVTFISVVAIAPNSKQPRKVFAEQEIQELSDSIKTLGVLQPILVRPFGAAGSFQIVAGERRYRAACKAGLHEIPVIVRTFSDQETLEVAIVENVQRQNLSPIEEAKSYQRLMDEFSQTAQEIAEKVGKDRATIANIVRVLRLPEVVQVMLEEGRITLGHAKAILTVKEPAAQIGLAKKVEEERLSVRALEAIVGREVVLEMPKKGGASESSDSPRAPKESVHPEIEERLRNVLGTKVSIHKTKAGVGSIELHFFSDEELDRLVDILSQSKD